MKKILLLLFIAFSASAFSQPLGNSWINYNKTYYKFKVGSNGLYRIPQSALATVGLTNTPAEQFQLWRNGEEVRIYTSSSTGPLDASGYIEFWGIKNDGKPDTKLYSNPNWQMSDYKSLETDTAAFFLTVNPGFNNLRFNDGNNNVAANILPADPYFINEKMEFYSEKVISGIGDYVGGVYLYSSQYENAEGFASRNIYSGFTNDILPTINFTGLNVYTAGPSASLYVVAAGNASNFRNIRASINGKTNIVLEEPIVNYGIIKKEASFPLSLISSNSANIDIENICTNTNNCATDRIVVSTVILKYPSTFNFNNSKSFEFNLPASGQGNYIVIDNFNYGSAPPILINLTTGERYQGNIAEAGKVKFALPTGGNRSFALVNRDVINNISSLSTRNFVNYSNVANQADYAIISHSSLFNNGSGRNYIEEYRAYRSSAAGGAYNAKIYDIAELSDQFAYGIKLHPAAIKDFVIFSKANFSVAPKAVFLIGKGVQFNDYQMFGIQTSVADQLSLVPTYGYPPSDLLLVSSYNDGIPIAPVGRLSVVNGNEVGRYLAKMIQFEAAQNSTEQTIAAKGWMKNVLQVVGGKDENESYTFTSYMNSYKQVIQDTFYGAKVTTFSKSTTAAVQYEANKEIEKKFKEGISFLSYFGHSSANVLEFNLSHPDVYENTGKYPFFSISGCTAGNNYIFDSLRVGGPRTISEDFVFADQKGSIAVLATTHYGLPNNLHTYNTLLYKYISSTMYGRPIGEILQSVVRDLTPSAQFDRYLRYHLEQINLHGDPALKINSHPKPDLVIEPQQVKFTPVFISIAEEKFTVDIQTRNIGKTVNANEILEVKRIYPDGSQSILYRQLIKAPYYMDSLRLTIPVVPTKDKGLNKLVVTVDADNRIDEMSESNNSVTSEFFIYEDEAKPVYPYNFAIINNPTQKLFASTANPFSTSKQYAMDLDTTALFNSPLKISKTVTSVGGLLQFDPGISFTNNTVYYWRTAIVPTTGEYHWNNSSFIYLANSSLGANQSHFYQFDKNYENINYNGAFNFDKHLIGVTFTTGNYLPWLQPDMNLYVGDLRVANFGQAFGTIQITALHPGTLDPFLNREISSTQGLYGSNYPGFRTGQFGFYFRDTYDRNQIMNFLDSIPNDYYVFISTLMYSGVTYYKHVDDWKLDAANNGDGRSLYNKLKELGFTSIDRFTDNYPFQFIYKKNNPSFAPIQNFADSTTQLLEEKFDLSQTKISGTISSPIFGPSKEWKELHWNGTDLEPSTPDSVQIEVYGVDYGGTEAKLITVYRAHDTSLAGINAATYPFIRLKMLNNDSTNATPHQLNYWRLNYVPAPEGAIAPNLFLSVKDTLESGEKLKFGIAFKNVSSTNFDSIKIKGAIVDANNVTHPFVLPKVKPLIAGDTVIFKYDIDTKNYVGNNTLYIDFNPDNDQPEQYHFNNFLYRNFVIRGDLYNPLLDVTFDGVHILNRDIVSAKPHIVIKLKDENKYLALADTNLIQVQLRMPGSTVLKRIYFDNDTLHFTPADISIGNNIASVDYTPSLQGNDDEYELIVSAKDVSGNQAGKDYRVSFRVIDKPMISNLLNYPNPFTTSTAFVFTLTGSQVPQNLKIQILTVTGKVVREITKDELGPIHIGRNITDFKWDGTDTYGQKLANGVYLYRFVSTLNGQSPERFKDQGDNTDKYFTKGYGKMYLMR
ncbi:hypothetical protein BH09BAC2_BH09BAC2_24050 [soil metagenome]